MNYKIENRVPLSKLQIIQQSESPIKRSIKIYSQKLPEDFFLFKTNL
jgi:hypothetical protein